MAVIYALLRVRLNNVQNVFVHQKSNRRRNRHHFSANGPFLLLPLALKWGLFGTFGVLAFLFTPLMITPKTVVAAEVPYITLTVPSSPLDLTVSPDNTLAETSSTDSAKITVSGNTYWGYTLSLTGGTDDGSLTGADNNKLATFSGDGAIVTNTWGYKFKKQNAPNPGDDKWLPGPKKDALTMLDTTAGNGNGTNKAEQSIYEFTLGAEVDSKQPAGQYHNTFTFTATVNAVSYTINYDNNDGDGGPGKVTSQTQEKSVKLSGVEPTRSGEHDYVFLGWCDRQVSEDGTCDGAIYQPNNDYEIKTANQNTTLYAIWDWITMQNWDDCSKNLVKNKQFTLVDSRDSKPYYVAKLADGNCWMTENLDYDVVAGVPLTAETTDLGYLNADGSPNANGNGNYQWTPDKSTYKNVEYTLWKNDNNIQQSYDPGEKCWNGIILTKDGGLLNSSTETCSQHDSSHFFLGNYYDYGAAVAQNSTSIKTKDGDKYETSICPAGWRLPEKDGDPSYINLFTQSEKYGYEVSIGSSGNIHKPPFYLFYDGSSDAKGVFEMGVKGLYRTNAVSAINGDNASYVLETHAGILAFNKSHYGGRRYHGFPVRCVTRL